MGRRMRLTSVLLVILSMAAGAAAAQPQRDREAGIKREIARQLTSFADWCLSRNLVEEARARAAEAREVDHTYAPLQVLLRKLAETAPALEGATQEELQRRKRELDDRVGPQYLSLFRWDHKRSLRPTYNQHLRRAFEHDPEGTMEFFDSQWGRSLETHSWKRLRRLYEVMETTALDQEVLLKRLVEVYEAEPPAGQRFLFDRALLRMYERRPDAVGSIFDAQWRAARRAEDYTRARYLLSRGNDVRRLAGIGGLMDQIEALEMEQLRALVVPGGRFVLRFPELGPTMRGPDHLMEMGVQLPRDYAAGGKWALLLALGGGTGSSRPSQGLAAGLPLISIGLPYPADPNRPRAMTPNPSLLWPMYREMIAKLEKVVPNIDCQRRVVFGFSNGAHAITGLIAESDFEFQKAFRSMALVEGGTFLEKWTERHWQSLTGNCLLFCGGDRAGKSQAQTLCRLAQNRGIDAELLIYQGGHKITRQVVTETRDWIERKVLFP